MSQAYFTISIDVEPDCSASWDRSDPLTFRSVLKGIPDCLQPLFNRHNAKPTYLLSAEVLEHRECTGVLASLDGCYELGTHLHPEYVDPMKKYKSYSGTSTQDFPCFDYPDEVEREKLNNLTDLFEHAIGEKPLSFRAGRFGADGTTIRYLAELGYLVDSSVTPGISWVSKGGPDFKSAPQQPYFPSEEDISKKGSSKILEVPVTIGQKRVLAPSSWYFFRWLRPSISSSRSMINLIKWFLKEYSSNDLVVLNMMFHSMELIPSASPYVKTKKQARDFLCKIEAVLKYCKQIGFQFSTLSALHRVLI